MRCPDDEEAVGDKAPFSPKTVPSELSALSLGDSLVGRFVEISARAAVLLRPRRGPPGRLKGASLPEMVGEDKEPFV